MPPVWHHVRRPIRVRVRDALASRAEQAGVLLWRAGQLARVTQICRSTPVRVRVGLVWVIRRAVDEIAERGVKQAEHAVDGSLKGEENILELACVQWLAKDARLLTSTR